MSKKENIFSNWVRSSSEITVRNFSTIEAAVEKQNFVNLFCSADLIQIDGRRLLLGKITYFKDIVILFDGLDEVVCHDYNKFAINARICCGKVLLPSSFLE